MIQSLIHYCIPCLHTFPKLSHPSAVGDFQFFICNPDLFFKLLIPISNNLLNFSTCKMNKTCLKQLVVVSQSSPSMRSLSQFMATPELCKKPLCYPYSDLSFSYSSNSWPGTTYKISLAHFSSLPPLLLASLIGSLQQLLTCIPGPTLDHPTPFSCLNTVARDSIKMKVKSPYSTAHNSPVIPHFTHGSPRRPHNLLSKPLTSSTTTWWPL